MKKIGDMMNQTDIEDMKKESIYALASQKHIQAF